VDFKSGVKRPTAMRELEDRVEEDLDWLEMAGAARE
jgi:hypothetical protein